MTDPTLPPLPGDADLRRLVHFSAGDGRIWLAGQRMLLVHAAALGALRRELVQTIGRDTTRRLLLRAGFAAGQRDAALARQVRPAAGLFEQFAVGPQLHMLEGAVQVTPEQFAMDQAAGRFHGVFRWDHSWEVETHVRDFGPQDEPVCWMLLGYASGYTTAFMGRPVLFKEVACAACGAAACRIEGRPADAWPDGEALARDYDAESLIVQLEDLQSQVDSLRSTLQPADELGPLIGRSKAFGQAAGLLRKAASTQVTVLLTGETGVGKERFARALHAMSPRADKPFVAVNCAALPGELIESELFGAERGAYTGAGAARAGRFERAHGGTLMLDELGELPLPAQAKLLRVLQTGEVERLGGTQPRKVDVRVVAATNVDLEAAVAAGRFRRDLMYRLNVYPIRIPPRERADDIEPLAQHLLQRFGALHGKRVAGFTDRALDTMRRYPWPGNVRELENLIERGVILASPGEPVDADSLFPTLPEPASATLNAAGDLEAPDAGTAAGHGAALYDELRSRQLSLDALEDALLHEAVRRADGNLAAAARALGITRPQLSYRLQRSREREAPPRPEAPAMTKRAFLPAGPGDDGTEPDDGTGSRTLIEQAYRQLRDDIIEGRLAPGEKLRVEHLRRHYAVGAGTLREAITRLVSDALVEAEGQRGFRVAPVALDDLEDLTRLRLHIEIEALRQSVRHGDAAWRARLTQAFEALSALQQPLQPADRRRFELLNARFHEVLVSAQASPWTLRLLRLLSRHSERYRRYAIGLVDSGRDVHAEHRQIYELAMAGAEARAALALEAHIRATPDQLLQAWRAGRVALPNGVAVGSAPTPVHGPGPEPEATGTAAEAAAAVRRHGATPTTQA